MQTSLAIYAALRQANVPDESARSVAEALERDMTINLATKQDIERLDFSLQQLEKRMDTRLESLEGRFSLKLEAAESRIVTRLAVFMTGLVALAGGLLTLLR